VSGAAVIVFSDVNRLTADELAAVLTLDEFETLARDYMNHMAYEYVAAGVADDVTLLENRDAFRRIQLLPRVLRDVSHIDTRINLFGKPYEFPILLAPTGYHKLTHPDGELETVNGANLSGATLIASSFSTVSFEQMSGATKRPLWFQIYLQPDRAFTKDLVQRAMAAGCGALCLSVDVPVNGPRDREMRARFALPEGIERANLSSLGSVIAAATHRHTGRNIYNAVRAANVTWNDLDWVRSLVRVPLLVKGILHPDDALRATEAGCDGIIVSNHGGRSIDTVPATIDALPAIADRVAGRVPVLLDGGIRRGTDVYKALARGASAVLIGRPYIYGLAVAGAAGVARVVEILRTELEMTMGLMGTAGVSEIGTGLPRRP
jgi:4-hydroxymandelate oxidase